MNRLSTTLVLSLALAFGSAFAADAPASGTPAAVMADSTRVEAEVIAID